MSSYRKNRTKSDISISDNSINVPVLQQINTLNSQPVMQVRRPSELNGSFTQPPNDSHSTVQIHKSPEGPEYLATPLNLINEESSVKECSDNQAYESLLFKKPQTIVNEFLVKEPVHWSQMFTNQGTSQSQGKEEEKYIKYAQFLGDKLFPLDGLEKQLDKINFIVISVEVSFFVFYLYQFPIILFGVAKRDYSMIYNLQIQLPLLFINLVQFGLKMQKSSKIMDYLPLTTFIPFLCILIDFNQQVIYLQLLHAVTVFRFYKLTHQLHLISLCLQQYTLYFFVLRITEIHFFQMICGFFIVLTTISNADSYFTVNCSMFDVLISPNSTTAIIYPLKIVVFIFAVYEIALIASEINAICSKQNTIIQNLNEISYLIKNLPFNLRLESLKTTYKQIHQRLFTFNQIDYDKLPEQLKGQLLRHLYQKYLVKLPIIETCLSKRTIQNILQNALKERVLEPNEILFEAQQENPVLYFVLSGKVKCYQRREKQQFYLNENNNGIYNQLGFFLRKQSDIGVQCESCCKVLELHWDLFMKEVNKSLNEAEKLMMCLDKVQFNQELYLIGVSCQICSGNHVMDDCKKVHYIPSKQVLYDYIYFDENNTRSKFERVSIDNIQKNIGLRKKFRCMSSAGMTEQVVNNVRHLLLLSSDTIRGRKTITSLGMQFDRPDSESSEDEKNQMSQQLQNLSPVPYVPAAVSSASSYPLKEIQQKPLKLSPKDSFMVHQKRYREKRQSHNPIIERIERDLSPSIIKYATIQDKKSQKSRSIISEEQGNNFVLNSSDNRQFSKYGIQSSKFTNETAKQFMNNPFEMPLYDLNQSLDNNHSYSDYFPKYNIDQALLTYKQYQDSIISSRSGQPN